MTIKSRRSRAVLNKAVLEVVENQIKGNDPPETRETYERLRSEGHSDAEARRLIGVVVAAEIFDILKESRPFDEESFVAALRRLPKLPLEDPL